MTRPLVEVEELLHEFVSGEGHSLRGDAADVVERQASVEAVLDPVLLVDVRQGLAQGAVRGTRDALANSCFN